MNTIQKPCPSHAPSTTPRTPEYFETARVITDTSKNLAAEGSLEGGGSLAAEGNLDGEGSLEGGGSPAKDEAALKMEAGSSWKMKGRGGGGEWEGGGGRRGGGEGIRGGERGGEELEERRG